MSHFTNITWGVSNVPATVNAPMQELSDAIDSHDHAGGDGAQIDHGGLAGLGDDDHTQYLLATGARTGASSSAQTFTNGMIGPSWKPSSNSTTALQLQNATGTSILNVDTTNNRIGINTTTPSYPLTVLSAGATASTEYLMGVFAQAATIKGINFGYYVGSGGTVQEARVRSVSNTPFALGTTTYPQAIYILESNGYVGIGTTTPSAPLEILRTGASPVEALRLTNTTNDSGPGLYIAFHGHSGYSADTARIAGVRAGASAQGFLAFYTRRDSTTVTEKMRLGYLGLALGDSYVGTTPPTDGMIVQGQVGIGSTSPGTMLNVLATDATTGAVTDVVTIGHNVTSGNPTDGFGSGTVFKLNSSTTASQSAALIQVLWATADHANRKARLTISAYDTAVREGLRVQASGSAPMIGFYGAAAVARATTGGSAATFVQNSGNAVNDASTFDSYTLGQVVTALRNIGVLT